MGSGKVIDTVLPGFIPRNSRCAAVSYCLNKCKLHGQAEEKFPAQQDYVLPLYCEVSSLICLQVSPF